MYRESRQGRRPAPPPLVPARSSSHTARFTLYLIASCGGRSRLQLEAEVQVVLRPILVEGPRLIRIQRVVLQRRIVEVHAVGGDREMLVHRISQRGGEGPDGVLSERRAAIEAAVERRPIGGPK